jgi:hypothetical protein
MKSKSKPTLDSIWKNHYQTSHEEPKSAQGASSSFTKAHENKIGVRALGFGKLTDTGKK